eukprot:scaffold7703_cov103-Isochrysis_galbana.AAC.14
MSQWSNRGPRRNIAGLRYAWPAPQVAAAASGQPWASIDNRTAALGGAGHPSQTASSEMKSRLANKARQDGAEKANEAWGAEIWYH